MGGSFITSLEEVGIADGTESETFTRIGVDRIEGCIEIMLNEVATVDRCRPQPSEERTHSNKIMILDVAQLGVRKTVHIGEPGMLAQVERCRSLLRIDVQHCTDERLR